MNQIYHPIQLESNNHEKITTLFPHLKINKLKQYARKSEKHSMLFDRKHWKARITKVLKVLFSFVEVWVLLTLLPGKKKHWPRSSTLILIAPALRIFAVTRTQLKTRANATVFLAVITAMPLDQRKNAPNRRAEYKKLNTARSFQITCKGRNCDKTWRRRCWAAEISQLDQFRPFTGCLTGHCIIFLLLTGHDLLRSNVLNVELAGLIIHGSCSGFPEKPSKANRVHLCYPRMLVYLDDSALSQTPRSLWKICGANTVQYRPDMEMMNICVICPFCCQIEVALHFRVYCS